MRLTIWASATIDEILSALHEQLLTGPRRRTRGIQRPQAPGVSRTPRLMASRRRDAGSAEGRASRQESNALARPP
jgi:hypothetical protein